MSDVRDLTLRFLECSGIESEADVLDVAEILANLGLVPGIGAYTQTSQPEPVEDVRRYVSTLHKLAQGGGRPDRRLMYERWVYGGIWLPAPGMQTVIRVVRRGGARDWDINVTLHSWSHPGAGTSLEAVAERGVDLLLQIGTTLYPRTRPSVGLLYGVGNDDVEMAPVILRRRLIVGWRTWYGPAYAEKYGREVLLGLPDRTELLDDGGVYHAIEVEPLDLVAGKPSVYAGVLSYLDKEGIRPAWPRMRRAKSSTAAPRRQEERVVVGNRTLEEFQQFVRELLGTAIVFEGGLRVLMLPLPEPWPELSAAEQELVFEHVVFISREIMTNHPEGRVRVEFNEIPPDLRMMLDAAFPPGGPVTFGLLTDDPPL